MLTIKHCGCSVGIQRFIQQSMSQITQPLRSLSILLIARPNSPQRCSKGLPSGSHWLIYLGEARWRKVVTVPALLGSKLVAGGYHVRRFAASINCAWVGNRGDAIWLGPIGTWNPLGWITFADIRFRWTTVGLAVVPSTSVGIFALVQNPSFVLDTLKNALQSRGILGIFFCHFQSSMAEITFVIKLIMLYPHFARTVATFLRTKGLHVR